MKRSLLYAALAAGLVVFGATSASAQEDGARARAQLESARELYASGNWETAREAYTAAQDAAPKDSLLEAEAALELSSLLWEQGDYDAAEAAVRTAMASAKKLGLDQAVGRLMLTLGHIEASKGRFAAAESTLKICVRSATDQKDANFAALCRINLRFVRQIQGKSSGSEATYRRDLKALENSGQAVLVGTALAKSAELQEKAGDHVGALNTLLAAQKQFDASQSVPSQSRHKLRLAQTYQNLGRWDDAERELDGLAITFQNMSNRPALVTTYALRGKQRAHSGQASNAVADFEKSLELAKSLGSPQLVANSRLAICEFYALADAMDRALGHCDAASTGFRKIGALSLAARAEVLGARVAQSQKSWLEARERYVKAIQTLEREVAAAARDPREIAVQKVNLCQVEVQLASNGAHGRCLEAGKALAPIKATDSSFRGMVAATHYAVGVSTPAKQSEEAMKALEKAAEGWIQLGNSMQASEALLRLGKLQADRKATRKASTKSFTEALRVAGAPVPESLALIVQIRIQLAQRQLDEKEWAGAKKTLLALVEVAAAAKDPYSGAWAHNALASAQLKIGDRAAAVAALEKGLPLAERADNEDLAASIRANLKKLGGK